MRKLMTEFDRASRKQTEIQSKADLIKSNQLIFYKQLKKYLIRQQNLIFTNSYVIVTNVYRTSA